MAPASLPENPHSLASTSANQWHSFGSLVRCTAWLCTIAKLGDHTIATCPSRLVRFGYHGHGFFPTAAEDSSASSPGCAYVATCLNAARCLGLPKLRFSIPTLGNRTGLIPHVREKYRCPLLFPTASGAACPIADPHWDKGGCTTTIAQGPGSRIRHTLDRDSPQYKELYAKRTMVERINSQAEALDILHPKLRRGRAIANRNTLTYVLINLRALNRIRSAATEARPAAEALALAA